MQFIPLRLPDVVLIQPDVYIDDRGFFLEAYQKGDFEHFGISETFVQDNHSGSKQGVLRGLHYQVCQPQGKLVRVVRGEIFDVAVDVRRGSPTCGHWVSAQLSAENKHQLWIPTGFAHGFYVLSEWAEMIYKVTDFYAPECERTLIWNDPKVGISWPLVDGRDPILSEKDAQGLLFDQLELFG